MIGWEAVCVGEGKDVCLIFISYMIAMAGLRVWLNLHIVDCVGNQPMLDEF
jgi:hypothetical protein